MRIYLRSGIISLILRVIYIIPLSLCFAHTYFVYFLIDYVNFDNIFKITLIYLYLLVIFIFPLYGIYYYFRDRIRQLSVKRLVTLFIGCVFCGFLIMRVLPIPAAQIPQRGLLQIIAPGLKNSSSQGSEVWVKEIFVNGELLPPTDFELVGDWEVRDSVPVSYMDQPAQLQWMGSGIQNIKINFLSHPWSGIAYVVWQTNQQSIDLYSPELSEKSIEINIGNSGFSLINIVTIVTVAVCIGTLLLICIIALAYNDRKNENFTALQNFRYSKWFAYAIPLAIAWLVGLLIYWPGLMSPDSFDQWGQVSSGNIENGHRFFHTLLLWLFSFGGRSLEAIRIFQIVFLALILSYCLYKLKLFGVSNRLVFVLYLLILISPVNYLMLLTIWSDVIYSILFVLFYIMLFAIIRSNGRYLKNWHNCLLFSVAVTILGLVRGNGLLIVAGVTVCLVGVYFLSRQKEFIASAALIMILVLFGQTGLPAIMGKKTQGLSPASFIAIQSVHHIAAHVSSGEEIDPGHEYLIDNFLPSDTWPYLCYSSIPLANGNWDYVFSNYQKYVSLAIDLFKDNPFTDYDHEVCQTAYIWQISRSKGVFTSQLSEGANRNLEFVTFNETGEWTTYQTKLPIVYPIIRDYFNQALYGKLWLFLSGGFWLGISIVNIILLYLRTRKKVYIILIAPLLLNTISLVLLSTTSETRYVYNTILIGMLSLLLPFLPKTENK